MLLKKKKLKFITENIKISFDDFLMINKILTKKVLMKKIKHRKLFLRKYKKVSAFASYLLKYQKSFKLGVQPFYFQKCKKFFRRFCFLEYRKFSWGRFFYISNLDRKFQGSTCAMQLHNILLQFISLLVILMDSVFKTGRNYYSQVDLEECKNVAQEKRCQSILLTTQKFLLILIKKILMKKFKYMMCLVFYI